MPRLPPEARAAKQQKLEDELETLGESAAAQIALMEEAKVRLTTLEETRQNAETKVRQRAERRAQA